MSQADVEAVLEIAKRLDALMFGKFQLSAGGTSNYYFDGRVVTLDPEGSYRVARAILPSIWDCGAEIVAGPAVAAVPIVASIAVVSFMEKRPVSGLIVRQQPKQHGAKREVEGSFRPGAKVVVVDDTCSTGGSIMHTIEALEDVECCIAKVVCILDRRMGGGDSIRRKGYIFEALLEADDGGNIVVANR